jgi:hypothetical protein
VDSPLRRRTRVPAEAPWAWFTDFEPSDLGIQRSLRAQSVQRLGPQNLIVERQLDFDMGVIAVRLEIRLRPPVGYDVSVHMAAGTFDMVFEFDPAGPGSDIVVTVRDVAGTPAADPEFRAQVLQAVSGNLDDYVPAMERELSSNPV